MTNNSNTYSIETENGGQLSAGLPSHTARRVAQRLADERNEAVYLYAAGEEDGDEVSPTEIEVEIDTPNGPRVTYGAQEAEVVEDEIPDGWRVDWSSAVDLAPSGTHAIRYAAPLVKAE